MIASYPSDIFEQREIQNVSGVVYDADQKTKLYVEDLQSLAAEIVAIQTVLGLNPNGSYDTVLAWLTSLALSGGGGSPNLDGGTADYDYGGIDGLDGGSA